MLHHQLLQMRKAASCPFSAWRERKLQVRRRLSLVNPIHSYNLSQRIESAWGHGDRMPECMQRSGRNLHSHLVTKGLHVPQDVPSAELSSSSGRENEIELRYRLEPVKVLSQLQLNGMILCLSPLPLTVRSKSSKFTDAASGVGQCQDQHLEPALRTS